MNLLIAKTLITFGEDSYCWGEKVGYVCITKGKREMGRRRGNGKEKGGGRGARRQGRGRRIGHSKEEVE